MFKPESKMLPESSVGCKTSAEGLRRAPHTITLRNTKTELKLTKEAKTKNHKEI